MTLGATVHHATHGPVIIHAINRAAGLVLVRLAGGHGVWVPMEEIR